MGRHDCCAAASTASAAPKPICPSCGMPGKPVPGRTVASLVSAIALKTLDGLRPYFCRNGDCDALYFVASGVIANKTDAVVRVGLKETEGPRPICYCFGFTYEDIAAEVAQGTASGPTIAARIRAEVRAGRCDCEGKNPAGSCCLGDVQRALASSGALPRGNRTETADVSALKESTDGVR